MTNRIAEMNSRITSGTFLLKKLISKPVNARDIQVLKAFYQEINDRSKSGFPAPSTPLEKNLKALINHLEGSNGKPAMQALRKSLNKFLDDSLLVWEKLMSSYDSLNRGLQNSKASSKGLSERETQTSLLTTDLIEAALSNEQTSLISFVSNHPSLVSKRESSDLQSIVEELENLLGIFGKEHGALLEQAYGKSDIQRISCACENTIQAFSAFEKAFGNDKDKWIQFRELIKTVLNHDNLDKFMQIKNSLPEEFTECETLKDFIQEIKGLANQSSLSRAQKFLSVGIPSYGSIGKWLDSKHELAKLSAQETIDLLSELKQDQWIKLKQVISQIDRGAIQEKIVSFYNGLSEEEPTLVNSLKEAGFSEKDIKTFARLPNPANFQAESGYSYTQFFELVDAQFGVAKKKNLTGKQVEELFLETFLDKPDLWAHFVSLIQSLDESSVDKAIAKMIRNFKYLKEEMVANGFPENFISAVAEVLPSELKGRTYSQIVQDIRQLLSN